MAAINPWGLNSSVGSANSSGLTSSAYHAVAVAPDDNTDLTTAARALYVGVTGNVTLVTVNDETVLFTAVPAGMILPVVTARVKSTGTTATGIVALY